MVLRHWLHLFWFSLAMHIVYLGFILVAAGSLATKKGIEVVLTAMNLDGAAKFLAPSVMDMALEQVVASRVGFQAEEALFMQRELASEKIPEMPEALRNFKGRGLLSDNEVVDINAVEAEIRSMNFGLIPEAVELPENVPAAGSESNGGTEVLPIE